MTRIRPLIVLIGFGALARVLLLVWFQGQPLYIHDESNYNNIAVNLAKNGQFALTAGNLTSIRPPLYPFSLSLLYQLFGTENYDAVRIAQALLSLANVVLLYHLANALFTQRVAIWAATLLCFYPSLLWSTCLLLTETAFTFWLLSLCLILQRYLQSRRLWQLLLFGVVLGLAALTRSVLWLFPPFLLVYLWFVDDSRHLASRLTIMAVPVIGFLLTIMPWSIRNTRLQKTFTTIDVMGGRNFMMGNYEHTPLFRAWDAISIQSPRAWYSVFAQERIDDRKLSQGQLDKLAMRHGLHFVVRHPVTTATRCIIKFLNFWQLERTLVAGARRGWWGLHGGLIVTGLAAVVVFVSYAVTLLAGVVGFAMLRPQDVRTHWFLLLLVGFVCAVHTAVFALTVPFTTHAVGIHLLRGSVRRCAIHPAAPARGQVRRGSPSLPNSGRFVACGAGVDRFSKPGRNVHLGPSSKENMPGICGIVDSMHYIDVGATVERMLYALRYHAWYLEYRTVYEQEGLAMGQVALDGPSQSAGRNNNASAFLHGEIYGAEPRGDARHVGAAARLWAGYGARGNAFLRELHGSYVAAMYDPEERRLVLINDRFGSRPLYFASFRGRFSWASSISALMADPDVPRGHSLRGISQFFTYGQYLGNDTCLEAVSVLPPAAILQCDLATGTVQIEQYYRLVDGCDEECPPSDVLERVDFAFKRAVDRRLDDANGLGLSLSGGLDARTILAVIDEKQTPLKTVCLGMHGSLDHRCAEQMSAIVGCPHHNHVLDANFLASFRSHLQQMVRLTDGHYLSQCIVMPTLPLYRELGIKILLRGHAGELLHMRKAYNYSLDDTALGLRDEEQLDEWLFQHLQAYMLDGVDQPLFVGELQQHLKELARESLRNCLQASATASPPTQRIWHLFVSERLRRETMMSMVKFNSVVEFRLPYLDNELVTLLLSIPAEYKLDELLQAFILQERRPEFLRITNSNTGAGVGASKLRKRVASLQHRVFAKLGVPGYQPYERLGLWLRRELKPTVEQILLCDETLDRGVFDPDGVRSVVTNHGQNRRNHTFLLMAMMIFELGQRMLTQQPVSPTPASRAEE